MGTKLSTSCVKPRSVVPVHTVTVPVMVTVDAAVEDSTIQIETE